MRGTEAYTRTRIGGSWAEGVVEKDSVLKTYVLTYVNGHIAEFAAGQETDPLEWDFFCECGRRDCDEQVRLTRAAYLALHEAERPVLAPRHRLNQAERAKRLAEEARALRAQAEQQIARARRRRP